MRLMILAFVTFLWLASSNCLQCLNEQGEKVDWWIMYKVPYQPDTGNTGLEYAYTDDDTPLKITGKLLTGDNALSHTLSPLYTSKEMVKIAYNDAPWEKDTIEKFNQTQGVQFGHTKGVVAYDSTSGFWLLHSFPLFPAAFNTSKYIFPKGDRNNGQTFFCLSLGTSEFNDVGEHLLTAKPVYYSHVYPSKFASIAPHIGESLANNWNHGSTTVSDIRTLGGQKIYALSKTSYWKKDAYEYLIAPNFESGIISSTWLNGQGGKLPSWCTPEYTYNVMNVRNITLGQYSWPNTKDHSKWAITSNSRPGYVCISSTNRLASQAKRGGIALCLYNRPLWNDFFKIAESDSCN